MKRKRAGGKPGAEPPTSDRVSTSARPALSAEAVVPATPTFPIVGIGASAGGLAAFEAFFSAMPANGDAGMAFVLVQHLAPDHKSILTDLVKRYTRMQVREVEDGMVVQPNCTYIIPPNRDMAFLNNALQLLEPAVSRGWRMPIDFFFRSLAQDQRERAICVVLSGTGSDGTQGIRSVKGEGGMVMAQNPESTEFDGMPRSAIATGLVDYVLPPAEMPAQLIAYVTHAFGKPPLSAPPQGPRSENALKKVFVLLRAQIGHDFSNYKRNTVQRRVERRMSVHQIDQMDDYVHYLQQTPAEAEALFRDLLIGVTRFFRDPEAFGALEQQVLPRILAARSGGAPIRVWTPGCSTGEEAYSIAILLHELMEARKQRCKALIFATDIDRLAIEHARAGVYPPSIAADVPPERLARYFSQESDGGAYRIDKSIRDMLVFSEQDVIKDPPFSKLDLISCRNLLIYMGVDLQKRLIPLFHYALIPGGTLFLGTAESVGDYADLFATADRKSKVYQRKDDVPGARPPGIARIPLFLPEEAPRPQLIRKPGGRGSPLREIAERALLRQYAPASALVSELGEILYLHSRTGRYLEPAPGDAGLNILGMAREGLRRDLTSALHQAVTLKKTVRRAGVRVRTNGDFATLNLAVHPISSEPDAVVAAGLFLVVFEEVQTVDPPGPVAAGAAAIEAEPDGGATDTEKRISALTRELKLKEDYLKASNEELETSNEELNSSNEEMQSINEELQSTNEELETSKEELQSVNEELATVNAELQTKVNDLLRANNDMNNLLSGTGIGTIFVDLQLRIQRFTPAVTRVINLLQTDVGRPVGHIVSNLIGYDGLMEDVQKVLDTLAPREVEVKTKAGQAYQLHIRPYRTLDNVIEGAVITFVDITDRLRAREALREIESLRRLAVVTRDAFDAVIVQDMEGRILVWNPGASRMYGWSEAEATAMKIRDFIPEHQREEALAIVERLAQAEVLDAYRAQRIARDGRVIDVWLTATALVNESGDHYAIATTERRIVGGKA